MTGAIQKHVAVVIVTYNASKWIHECLKSVLDSSVRVLPIVIDNNSTDNTSEILNGFQNVSYVPLRRNVGFGAANNVGIAFALDQGCEFVFLLNQDARVESHTIQKLVEQTDDRTYGILSPVHLNRDGDTIDPLFVDHLTNYGGKDFFSDLYLGRPIQPIYPVDFLNAAAWLITREFLVSVGGFDPLFFMYGEDDDLCRRAILNRYKVGLVPSARAYHYREKSDKSHQQKVLRFTRWNRAYSGMVFRLKWTHRPLAVDFMWMTIGLAVSIIAAILRLRFDYTYTMTRAYLQVVLKLLKIVKSRRASMGLGEHRIQPPPASSVQSC